TGLDMYWLKQGDTSGTAGFGWLVLGFLLTVLVIILTPRVILMVYLGKQVL
ncbi:hypothetical protein JOQ06_029661, partial [Pogonophryne albipinna]